MPFFIYIENIVAFRSHCFLSFMSFRVGSQNVFREKVPTQQVGTFPCDTLSRARIFFNTVYRIVDLMKP